jgi:hypothetical protein
MSDFFDLPDDSFVKKNTSDRKTDSNIYNPDPNAFNGSYKSVFRFVPYIHDKTMSKFTKYSAKFWNPLTKEALYVDCPSNVGKPSILWDIERVIKGLEKEEPELHKKLKDSFSRWHSNWSPVYIKKDPQRPELEGQIKFFKFSSQINTIIDGQINPEENELVAPKPSINPYHLLKGKDFLCVVGKKTKVFRDWSKCEFMDDVTPLVFKVGDKQVAVENSENSIKLVQEFLTKNTPKLDEYFHRAWTPEQFDKVAEAIVSTITPRPVLNMVLDRTKDSDMKAAILAKLDGGSAPNVPAANLIDESVEFKSEPVAPAPTVKTHVNNEDPLEPVSASGQATEEKDEYDALFDDM